jgi:hypothetical protein
MALRTHRRGGLMGSVSWRWGSARMERQDRENNLCKGSYESRGMFSGFNGSA